MTNTQLLILLVVLTALYLYWKSQQQPALKAKKDTETEIFWDASDWELDSDSETEDNNIPTEQKDWFSDQRWLTDAEIDWALNQIYQDLHSWDQAKYKILEATQFMFLATVSQQDKDARIAFPVLLSELTDNSKELVFIPVNNPNFHWSLLVYETSTKKFYHYDTLKGANYTYIETLCTELTKHLREENHPTLTEYLVKKHQIKQGNTWDCGIALIAITARIIEQYKQNLGKLSLGQFDFPQARKHWRKQLINHYAKKG